eukprot:1151602-Pelagomonas_calceolata.AAC.8
MQQPHTGASYFSPICQPCLSALNVMTYMTIAMQQPRMSAQAFMQSACTPQSCLSSQHVLDQNQDSDISGKFQSTTSTHSRFQFYNARPPHPRTPPTHLQLGLGHKAASLAHSQPTHAVPLADLALHIVCSCPALAAEAEEPTTLHAPLHTPWRRHQGREAGARAREGRVSTGAARKRCSSSSREAGGRAGGCAGVSTRPSLRCVHSTAHCT